MKQKATKENHGTWHGPCQASDLGRLYFWLSLVFSSPNQLLILFFLLQDWIYQIFLLQLK